MSLCAWDAFCRSFVTLACFSASLAVVSSGAAFAAADAVLLAEQIRTLPGEVIPESDRQAARQTLSQDLRRRLREANRLSSEQWQRTTSREAWESFRSARLADLRKSLGTLRRGDSTPATHITGRITGEGFSVEKLLFESRPGLWVTANLYRPVKTESPRPGILICHSHHNPKTQEELQTMGMSWARFGALVLVMDQLGHGERRQHPFRTAADYPAEFRVGRQDYFYRYDTSLQLSLVGESLMGWMVGDMMRGIDVLLAQDGVDQKQIILIGAVAGGGDPAAVTAALDERIAAAVPFNFGGPQPENRYPLPEDAEQSFPYAGGGSWESTRNLRLSASQGFLPWAIVGGIAPRKLIYAHEFSWDQPRDPVWQRLQKVYGWYQADENLSFAHGAGLLQGKPPEATHCNNVGRAHRKMIYPALERWFGMAGSIDEEYSRTVPASDLHCWTPQVKAELKPKLAHELAAQLAAAHQLLMVLDRKYGGLPHDKQREIARGWWADLLGNVEPNRQPNVRFHNRDEKVLSGAVVERLLLEVEPGISVSVVLLLPELNQRAPLVVCVSQHGKERFLDERALQVAELLSAGLAVAVVEVRGTGETAPADDSRDRTSTATSLSASEWMLGGTLLGARLRDLRTVLTYLRTQKSIATDRIALWGDSFAPTNSTDVPLVVPHGIDKRPHVAEPLGGLLALITALFEDDVDCVYIRRGLLSYASCLDSPAVHLPHDAIVPGATVAGDLPGILGALPAIDVHFAEPIDGANRTAMPTDIDQLRTRVERLNAKVRLTSSHDSSESAARWLARRLATSN
jgi:cephalosporin-C deacetylase-like acetyl esterase